jgi:hypothetical protein
MDQEDDDLIRVEDQTPEFLMWAAGVDEFEANFILALERGEISGDVIALDEGEPMP